MKVLRTTLVLFIIIATLFTSTQEVAGFIGGGVTQPKATAGLIDTRDWDFAENGIMKLRGEWEFHWMELLEPSGSAEIASEPSSPTFINIPSDWTSYSIDGENLPADGYATLRLQVRVEDIEQTYGLKFKYFSSAMKLWVNGNLMHASGLAEMGPDTYTSRYIPAEVFFAVDSHDIEIVVQAANYHHRRVKLNDVYFGTESQIYKSTQNELIITSAIFGSMLLIAMYYFILYFIQRRDKAALYFAIVALVIALRHGIMNERILMRLFPDMLAEIMTKIGYLPAFILLPLLILYVREIFPSPTLNVAARISKYATIVFTIMVLVTQVTFYDWLFEYGQVAIFLAAGYMIYVLIKDGFFQQIRGAWIMTFGHVIILVAAISDYLRELNIIRGPDLLSLGILIFILLQAIFLAWKFNDSYIHATQLAEDNEAMYEELQELNELLDQRVQERTKELEFVNARLEQLSRIDGLTGIANRRSFDERFLQEWKRSQREQVSLSIILLDIDYFKPYNDNYGHIQGDECLKQIANEVANSVGRGTDFAARYGGEEFVVLLPNTLSEGAISKAEAIRMNIEGLRITHEYSNVSEYCTVSLGVNTIVVSEKDSIEDFINKADRALYRGKESGRNRTIHADEL